MEYPFGYVSKRNQASFQWLLLQTFLIQDTKDTTIWRIISEWRSKEEYENLRESEELDSVCLEMFRKIGVEPTRRIFEARGHHAHV